jgi:hypothetical protein
LPWWSVFAVALSEAFGGAVHGRGRHRELERRVGDGIGHLVQCGVVEVGQVVAELVVARLDDATLSSPSAGACGSRARRGSRSRAYGRGAPARRKLRSLSEANPVAQLPERIQLLECRLRVNGERRHFRGPNWGWTAEPDALWQVVEAGIAWSVRNGPRLPLTFKVRTTPVLLLRHDQEIHASFRRGLDASAEVGVVRLTSAAPHRFRTLVVEPSRGRVSLIEGGTAIEGGGWQTARSSLRVLMQATSAKLVYGFLKRGSYLPAAESGYSLSQDWPPAEHHQPSTQLGEAFEAEYAPDAFGLQLLGPAYAGRLLAGPDWTEIPADAGRVILEHRDPAAWFAEALVPFGGRPNYTRPPIPPVPNVLARARHDFADILFTDELAWRV